MDDYQKLLIVAGVYLVAIIAQFFLSGRKSWALGLLLPVVSFGAAAVFAASRHAADDFSVWWNILLVALWFLIYNLGTIILIAVFVVQRRAWRRRRKQRELEQATEAELLRRSREIEEERLQKVRERAAKKSKK